MSIFTGLFPSVHGIVNKYTISASHDLVDSSLSPAIQTLPRWLKAHGYLLAGFTGDAGVTGKFGFGRGFDVYLDDQKFGGLNHSMPAALDWIGRHKNRKFFLFLHGYDVHGQYDPPSGYTCQFCGDYHGPLKGGKEEQAKFREEGLANIEKKGSDGEARLFDFTPADADYYKALYDEKIKDMDARFGEFMSALARFGLLNKTILVVVSDHGDEFMEHQNIDHGPTLYDELVRVVFLIRFPQQRQRVVVDDLVSTMDALPTALGSVGIPVPPRINGRSLIPLVSGKERSGGPVFFETDYRLFTHKRGVRVGRYKFILTLQSNKKELYDLVADPGERHNLVDREPRRAYELEQIVLYHLKEMHHGLDPQRYQLENLPIIKEY